MAHRSLSQQLRSLHAVSVEIAALRNLQDLYDQTLAHCLALTESEMGAIVLLTDQGDQMEIVAVKGFESSDRTFLTRYRTTPVRPSLFGLVVIEGRSRISNDVEGDPQGVGTPAGHPALRTFLGVPLRVGSTVIGMIAVANRPAGYDSRDERLLTTFAGQVAVAIENARLYERQAQMIARLESYNQRLNEAERHRLLTKERDRIAGGLHADIQQGILAIGLRLNAMLDRKPDPTVARELREIRELARRTAQEVTKVVHAVTVGDGQRPDFSASVRALLQAVSDDSGLETHLVVIGVALPIAPSVHDALYAVTREALTNVVKHAKADLVVVHIRYGEERIDVVVQDDGVGMGDLTLRTHADEYRFGLRHMRQVVLEVGGSFEVTDGDETGVTVSASVPRQP